jgi:uncharacterized protein (TIGR02284 family)
MASTSENIVDVLQELTEFVNDRIEGYERAVKESKNPEFQTYYRKLASQSTDFSNELNSYIRSYGGDMERDTTIKGKFYRQWMDVKAAFTGRDEEAILGSNIYGEEWAIKAYNDALESGNLPPEIRQAVDRQRQASIQTYNQLKQMKDVTGSANDVRSDNMRSDNSGFSTGSTGYSSGSSDTGHSSGNSGFSTGGTFSTSGDKDTF